MDEGAGEPALFVHGTPTWSYEWRHLIPALVPRWRCADLWRRERLRGRPVLVVWGLRDPAFRLRHLEQWTTLFGSGARVARPPSAGHWPHEEEAEAVRHELRAFLHAA